MIAGQHASCSSVMASEMHDAWVKDCNLECVHIMTDTQLSRHVELEDTWMLVKEGNLSARATRHTVSPV